MDMVQKRECQVSWHFNMHHEGIEIFPGSAGDAERGEQFEDIGDAHDGVSIDIANASGTYASEVGEHIEGVGHTDDTIPIQIARTFAGTGGGPGREVFRSAARWEIRKEGTDGGLFTIGRQPRDDRGVAARCRGHFEEVATNVEQPRKRRMGDMDDQAQVVRAARRFARP